jgi:hypothetical protein
VAYVTAGIPTDYWVDRGNRHNIVDLALAGWSGMKAVFGFVQICSQLLLAQPGGYRRIRLKHRQVKLMTWHLRWALP